MLFNVAIIDQHHYMRAAERIKYVRDNDGPHVRIKPDIVIATPDGATAKALKDALCHSSVDHSLRTVETIPAFAAALDSIRPDTVFATWQMPGLDAVTVLEMCRARDPNINVVVVSSELDDTAIMRIVEAGAHDILLMPHFVRLGFVMRHAKMEAVEREWRRLEEEKYREKDSLCRALVEQEVAGIFIFRGDRTIRFVNPRFAKMLGYDVVDVVGRDFAPFVVEGVRSQTIKMFEQVASGRSHSVQVSSRIQTKSGGTADLFGQLTAGNYLGEPAIIGVSLDVTALRRAERALQQSEKRLRRSMEATVQAIASTLEMRDAYTAGHQREVARLAVAIAHELGMPEEEREGIYLAASVHDIGKISVPTTILNKPGPLTDDEFVQIRSHPNAGYEIIKHVDFPWPVAQMIRQHHERMDGSGYPAGLKGDDIILGARIIAVADVVQSMSMARSYRGPVGVSRALAEIEKGRGRLYDPACVDACIRLFREKGYKFA